MAQMVKKVPAIWETWVQGMGRSPGGGHGSPLQYSFLENSHEQRSLAGYSQRDHKELDKTEQLNTHNSWEGYQNTSQFSSCTSTKTIYGNRLNAESWVFSCFL